MKNRWRFDCRASTPPPGTGGGEWRRRNKGHWLRNYCGLPAIDRNGPSPKSAPIPVQTRKSQPEPGGERENGGNSSTRTGGATSGHLWFYARPIPSIAHTNSKTPENRGGSNGFKFLFMSQKQSLSVTHKHATKLCDALRRQGLNTSRRTDVLTNGCVSPCQRVKREV